MDIGVRASTLVDWVNVLLWNHMKKSTGYNSHDGGGTLMQVHECIIIIIIINKAILLIKRERRKSFIGQN